MSLVIRSSKAKDKNLRKAINDYKKGQIEQSSNGGISFRRCTNG